MNTIALPLLILVAVITATRPANGDDSILLANSTVTHVTATKVMDSKNHLVGTLVDSGGAPSALVGFNGAFFVLPVSSNGFVDTGELEFYFQNSDCSGPAWLPAVPASLNLFYDISEAFGGISDGILYFAQKPTSQFVAAAAGRGVSPADAAAKCQTPITTSGQWGLVGTFDLSRLGLVPPFKLK